MKTPKGNKFIDELMLLIVAIAVGAVAVLNLCQTDRPTYSEIENRDLATMPELTGESLLDGSFFSGTSAFVSDTFFARDQLSSFSKVLDTYKSLSLIYKRSGITVIIDPNPSKPDEDESDITSLPPLPSEPEESDVSDVSGESSEPVINTVPVKLSAKNASVSVGATYLITATVGDNFRGLTWTCSSTAYFKLTDNGDGTATVRGTADGSADVTATVTDADGNEHTASCRVTVTKPFSEESGGGKEVADFLPNGLFIYDGAAYSQSYFSSTYAPKFAELYSYYAKLFPSATVSVVTAPLSTIIILDPEVSSKISDQGKILDKLENASSLYDDVNFVNLKNIYLDHASEYLFFKSDHHWTDRGAYYAYYAFADSVGLNPVKIEDFDVKVLNTSYIGSMYKYTGDERVKYFYDTVEAYLPGKTCTMTIYDANGSVYNYDSCIRTSSSGYTAFLAGDHAYTVINVPENPQNKNVLVIKDSFGNAFVPFLTEHYGNIIVIDPRYVTFNVYEQFKDYGFTDIVFMMNTTSANSKAWYNYMADMVK